MKLNQSDEAQDALHKKQYILFPNVLKIQSFQKNPTRISSFLYYWERWYFFFPKIWSYSLDGKCKTIFLKKKTWKYDIFFKCPKKMVFLKNLCWNMIFLVLSGKMVFFFRKIWYFFFGRKMKDNLSQEIHENMIFLYICMNVKNMIFSWENTFKGDWDSRSHSRKSSNDFLCFYRDLHRRFHVYLCSEKKHRKFSIYDWNLTSSSVYLVGDILQ